MSRYCDEIEEKHCDNCRYSEEEMNFEKCIDCDAEDCNWEPKNDNINHPAHYTAGKFEVLDVIEDWKLNYIEGNIIKYIARYKYKNGIEDLKKAQFYLNRLIDKKCEK